jgi:hypothetical protein
MGTADLNRYGLAQAVSDQVVVRDLQLTIGHGAN